jgi:hypothetical protein
MLEELEVSSHRAPPREGISADAIREISNHAILRSKEQPHLVSLIRHQIKQNGLVTIVEHYPSSLDMAFNQTEQAIKMSERTAAYLMR